MIRRAVATTVDVVRAGGLRGLVDRIGKTFAHRTRFRRYRVDLGRWSPRHPLPASLTVTRGVIAELEAFRSGAHAAPLASEFFCDRVDGARWFYLGRWEGAVAHILWVYEPADRTPLMRLGPGEVEIRRVYTLREHRGRRIFTAALGAVLADLRRLGVRTVYAHVEVDNRASARAFLDNGFALDGDVELRKLLGVPSVAHRPGRLGIGTTEPA
jgi:GNAT superfamily N-acetyltransferase